MKTHPKKNSGTDNPELLNQDCDRKLFAWFITRAGWQRHLRECTEKKPEENSMNLEIVVKAKDVYGQMKFYPECEKAKTFASIAGTTTLTEATLRKVMQLGYEVKVERQEIQLQGVLK